MSVIVSDLILASRVIGTPVRNDQERLGHIEDVAISKRAGHVEFAVLSMGGVLVIGRKYHPVPWTILTYDTGFNGYAINLDKGKLRTAPSYSLEELADVGDFD